MEQPILKGNIYITSNIEVVYGYSIGIQNKVITLDEDGLLPEDDNIIGGSCLLPPIMAKLAESDGNETEYEMIYKNHLLSEYPQGYIGALLSSLYLGKNLLLFLPELGYSFTRDKLCQYIFQLYGISIGILDKDPNTGMVITQVPCWYDNSAIPIWLNLIYEARVMDAYEYLRLYPADADLKRNTKIMNILLSDLRPFGKDLNEKIDTILRLHKNLHKHPKSRLVIHSLI